jgi:GxxExxY protein
LWKMTGGWIVGAEGKREFEPISAETEAVAAKVIEGAFRVHRHFGPGLFESVYETCLCHELAKQEIAYGQQVPVPVEYDGIRLDEGFKVDVWVDARIVLELKAVEELIATHKAQLLTYMKLTQTRLGFLINFNAPRLKDGIVRMVL